MKTINPSKTLIILGHPRPNSFCSLLADRYLEIARSKGQEVTLLRLHELKFNLNLETGFENSDPLEPDLIRAQKLIADSSHIVFIYPNWWGTMPALLKGFLDRVLLPNFAFKYHPEKMMPIKLLKGRTADLIITMDTPPWIYRFLLGSPGLKIMKTSILNFCGIKVKQTVLLGPIRKSDKETLNSYTLKLNQLFKKA